MGDPWPRTSRGPVGNDSMEACTTRRLTPARARDCVHNPGPIGSLSPSGEQQHESAPEEVQTSLERELMRTVKSAPRTVKPDLETTDPRKRHFTYDAGALSARQGAGVIGLSARAQKGPSCARLCGRDVHRNVGTFFLELPLVERVSSARVTDLTD